MMSLGLGWSFRVSHRSVAVNELHDLLNFQVFSHLSSFSHGERLTLIKHSVCGAVFPSFSLDCLIQLGLCDAKNAFLQFLVHSVISLCYALKIIEVISCFFGMEAQTTTKTP